VVVWLRKRFGRDFKGSGDGLLKAIPQHLLGRVQETFIQGLVACPRPRFESRTSWIGRKSARPLICDGRLVCSTCLAWVKQAKSCSFDTNPYFTKEIPYENRNEEHTRVHPNVLRDWVDNEIYAYNSNTRWEATQRVMAAKLTRLTHKIAMQLYLVADSCTICSSRSRWPVRKLLDTTSYQGCWISYWRKFQYLTQTKLLWHVSQCHKETVRH
jgi:hypothetical protein